MVSENTGDSMRLRGSCGASSDCRVVTLFGSGVTVISTVCCASVVFSIVRAIGLASETAVPGVLGVSLHSEFFWVVHVGDDIFAVSLVVSGVVSVCRVVGLAVSVEDGAEVAFVISDEDRGVVDSSGSGSGGVVVLLLEPDCEPPVQPANRDKVPAIPVSNERRLIRPDLVRSICVLCLLVLLTFLGPLVMYVESFITSLEL